MSISTQYTCSDTHKKWAMIPFVALFDECDFCITHSHKTAPQLRMLPQRQLMLIFALAKSDIDLFELGKKGVQKRYQDGQITRSLKARLIKELDHEIILDKALLKKISNVFKTKYNLDLPI